jgi:hypothetical protein
MDTLLRHRNGAKPTLQTLSSGILKVEIFPLIFTSVKWSEYGEDHIPVGDKFAPRQRTMLDDEAGLRQDVFELLRRIEDSTTSLNAIRKQVETKFGQKVPKGRKPQK